ncbi:MAG: efflux RND transporter periplasmic adaptor subunit [Candidatus Krumholzibacteriia bacterium]
MPKRTFNLRTPGLAALIAVVAVLAFMLGGRTAGDSPATDPHAGHREAGRPDGASAPEVWTCSMHPQIQLPEKGKCPICFMDLIPLENGGDDDLGPRTLELSEGAAALAEIRTTAVTRASAGTTVRLIGKVQADETRTRTIAARIAGRIDTLFVDYTGAEVSRGQPLLSLYSPDLYAGQTELIAARRNVESLAAAGEPVRASAATALEAARRRLLLWGLSPEQVDRIAGQETPATHLRIEAPIAGVVTHRNATMGAYVQTGTPLYTVTDLSRVWVVLDAYEQDLPWLRTGQDVDFTVSAVPGHAFAGSVVFIDPVVDEKTRTAEVRLSVDNAERLLKPGMLAGAVVRAGSPAEADRPLVIPASAPLRTGKRAVVYVRLPHHDKPAFEGREIVLGPRTAEGFIVAEGLEEGELVVTNGAFKIDSALQIQAKPSMMSPLGGGAPPAHHHGDGASMPPAPTEPDTGPVPAPRAFRAALVPVLDAYLELTAALAADADGAAAAAVGSLHRALEAVPGDPGGEAARAWTRDAADLAGPLAAMTAAEDIDSRRRPLQDLTLALWRVLERYQVEYRETVRRFNCPMAYGNQGGDWLQLDPTTANPYFGAAMLRCGLQTDSLGTAAAEERR